MNTKIVLTGQFYAGKDHVANTIGATIFGFADPIYEIAEHFFGTSDKSRPGIRQFIQTVGQWGWGNNDQNHPYTVERAVLVDIIRQRGHQIAPSFSWVDWSQFGKRRDFWVNILRRSVGRAGRFRPDPPEIITVTNARFWHELLPLVREDGFVHFHVRCGESSRRWRMHQAGVDPDDTKIANNISEELAKELDRSMPIERMIWNDDDDHQAAPEGSIPLWRLATMIYEEQIPDILPEQLPYSVSAEAFSSDSVGAEGQANRAEPVS